MANKRFPKIFALIAHAEYSTVRHGLRKSSIKLFKCHLVGNADVVTVLSYTPQGTFYHLIHLICNLQFDLPCLKVKCSDNRNFKIISATRSKEALTIRKCNFSSACLNFIDKSI